MVQILEGLSQGAQANMDRDRDLLYAMQKEGEVILHLYDWKSPSLTYGYFVKPEDFLNLEAIDEVGIDMGRRPTGGGIIFHAWDLAFGVIIPASHPGYSDNTLENYDYINSRVKLAVSSFIKETGLELLHYDPVHPNPAISRFCMAKPTIYDVMLNGRKIAGAAQRKKPNAYLHQGSISLAYPRMDWLEKVLKDPAVLEAMQQQSYYLLPQGWSHEELGSARHELAIHLKRCF